MLSSVKRYKKRLSVALVRYFPRTAAYLEAEKAAAAELAKISAQPRSNGQKREKTGTKTRGEKPGRSAKKPVARPQQAAVQATTPSRVKGRAAIYPAAGFKLSSSQQQAMRATTAKAVAAGIIAEPSAEQWPMILTSQPLTRVFAGAGSGKSTTLVLRLVFMLCHLQIPLERLTVISFTNASCAELRERLLRLLRFWQAPFSETAIRQCVRTFHATMAMQARQVLGNPQWFEQLGSKAGARHEADNPLASAKLSTAQQNLLKQAYQTCYAEQVDFRQTVHALLDLPVATEAIAASKVPLHSWHLPGELRSAPLFELFHEQASFMQSIGICVADIKLQQIDCSPRERQFLQALQYFHASFMALLAGQGLTTFDAAFVELTKLLEQADTTLGESSLHCCAHLLIDEFQDISPQIVRWLQALQSRLASKGEMVSLMAIGDDWQSIYGWRGSSPELFMDFDRHFPRSGKMRSEVLMLQRNYRSLEPVLKDAQKLLQPVLCKQPKQAQAIKEANTQGHGVRLLAPFDSTRQLPELISLIEQQCSYAQDIGSKEPCAVLLLGRRNQVLNEVRRQLRGKLPVKICTIHGAKGLQAEVAIILDDCQPTASHPLRNALYAYCGFFTSSYDQAMADENLRLGYVAITRGVSRVFWCLRKPQGAASLL